MSIACFTHQDYPLRGRTSPGGVVHAVKKGPRYSWGRSKDDIELTTACRRFDNVEIKEEPPHSPITCKNCLKALGDTDYKKETSIRYAVRTRDGLYLKKTGWRQAHTGELSDAKLFKTLHPAVTWACRKIYFDEAGRETTRQEMNNAKMPYKLREKLAKYRLIDGCSIVKVITEERGKVDLSKFDYMTE